jgi:hypothetical protein
MNKSDRLLIKTESIPPLRASKWLTSHVLLDESEMEKLLNDLGEIWMFPLGGVIPLDRESISHSEFLEVYKGYVSALKQGVLPTEQLFRRCLTSAWTCSPTSLYSVPLPDGFNELIKIEKPVIQLQHHTLDYSLSDDKFRSMVFGPQTISWGIQFSYPQLYQDRSMETFHVVESEEFPDTLLFKTLQRWIRAHTSPTPFLIGEKKVNSSIRLGKACFEWINRHPQLANKGLRVETKGT